MTIVMRRRFMLGTVAILLVASVAACATAKPRTYTARVASVPSIGMTPLPLRAAVIIPDAARLASQRQELQCGWNTMPVTLQSAQAVERAAALALQQALETADIFRDPAAAGTGYDLYIEVIPSEVVLNADCGLLGWDRARISAKAVVKARVTDRQDRTLLEESYASLEQSGEQVSEIAGKALADAMHAVAVGLIASAPVRAVAKAPPPSGTRSHSGDLVALSSRVDGKADITGVGFAVGFDYVLTAYHVIAGMPSVTVRTGGRAVPALIVLRDRGSDIALLKLLGTAEHSPFAGLKLGDPSRAREGDAISVLDFGEGNGRPTARDGRIASGIAKGDPRLFYVTVSGRAHSGAPVVNQNGEVIGVAIAKQDAAGVFTVESLPEDVVPAIKIQYANALLNLLPEAEYIAPAAVKAAGESEDLKRQLVAIEARR